MPDQPQRMFTPTDEAPAGPPTPVRVIELMAGFMVSKTLFAALDAGLFAAGGGTPAELAERCGIPERSARAMADLMADAGLLVRDGDGFRNAPDAEAFLAGHGPFDMRPLARYWDTVSYPTWARCHRGVPHPARRAPRVVGGADGGVRVGGRPGHRGHRRRSGGAVRLRAAQPAAGRRRRVRHVRPADPGRVRETRRHPGRPARGGRGGGEIRHRPADRGGRRPVRRSTARRPRRDPGRQRGAPVPAGRDRRPAAPVARA